MEKRRIKRNGNSVCVNLDRGTLENVYKLKENDEVVVDYDYPEIIINVPKAQERVVHKEDAVQCSSCRNKKITVGT